MIKRLLAITFIFLCTAVAWAVLGGTILARTNSSGERLRGKVESVWGVPQTQTAPVAEYYVPITTQDTVLDNGQQKTVARVKQERHAVIPSLSEISTTLTLEPRQKGLLWYSTYKVDFRGDYEFRNPDDELRHVTLMFSLPAARAVYDNLQFVVNGAPVQPVTEGDKTSASVDLDPHQTVKLSVAYRSQGLDSWAYSFGSNVNRVQNFHLRMITNFGEIDFPDNTLAPTEKNKVSDGWQLDWRYANLLSGYQIAMAMPEQLQPGPIASEISFFAPVSLLFFFFAMFIVTTVRNIELHPMNYFFLAAAFFAFHLLLAYLVDHLNMNISFLISSAVSVLLVVSYLRLVTGTAFALREAALAQFLYLVLFSFAFFFRGYTGLAITIGAIVSLFVAMQLTGRIRWAERFARTVPPLPVP